MPIQIKIGGVEVTVDSAQEAAVLLQNMNVVQPATPPTPEPEPPIQTQVYIPPQMPEAKTSSPIKEGSRRLSFEKANIIRNMHAKGHGINEIADALSVNRESVRDCIAGKIWNSRTVEASKKRIESRKKTIEAKKQGLASQTPQLLTPKQQIEVVELILAKENLNDIMKAYGLTPQTLIQTWTTVAKSGSTSMEMSRMMLTLHDAILNWYKHANQNNSEKP